MLVRMRIVRMMIISTAAVHFSLLVLVMMAQFAFITLRMLIVVMSSNITTSLVRKIAGPTVERRFLRRVVEITHLLMQAWTYQRMQRGVSRWGTQLMIRVNI